jgi:DNA-binding response OmpR family regulator
MWPKTPQTIGVLHFSCLSMEHPQLFKIGARTRQTARCIRTLTWNQLMTRVRREIAPSSTMSESHIVRFGQVSIDLLAMEVCRSDRPVGLTAMEFKVLKFFVLNPTRVISRDDMLDQVWDYENYPYTRTVDNQVLKLRQKLETEAGHPVHFRTGHGVGYKFIP